MPVDDVHFRPLDDVLATPTRRRKTRPGRSIPESPSVQPALLDWARGVAAAAERRVAELEARIAYLESQVTTDELTGLLNRRGFIDAFLRANAAARRTGSPGAVVLADLNGFKQLNDRMGHAHGDHMLREMGGLVQRYTRKMDAVARIGGDEFALLLPGAPLDAAMRKCRFLESALNAIGLSASFGGAVFDGHEDEDAVLHRADMAMYEEKHNRAGG